MEQPDRDNSHKFELCISEMDERESEAVDCEEDTSSEIGRSSHTITEAEQSCIDQRESVGVDYTEEFLKWVNDGVIDYTTLSEPVKKYLYTSFLSIIRNMPSGEDYNDLYISRSKNSDISVLITEQGKPKPRWKKLDSNVGYSDPQKMTVRYVLESIPMSRYLTQKYRDLEQADNIKNYLHKQYVSTIPKYEFKN